MMNLKSLTQTFANVQSNIEDTTVARRLWKGLAFIGRHPLTTCALIFGGSATLAFNELGSLSSAPLADAVRIGGQTLAQGFIGGVLGGGYGAIASFASWQILKLAEKVAPSFVADFKLYKDIILSKTPFFSFLLAAGCLCSAYDQGLEAAKQPPATAPVQSAAPQP